MDNTRLLDNPIASDVPPATNTGIRDPYSVWNGTKFVFTLRKIAAISNITIPDHLADRLDTPIMEMTSTRTIKKPDGANLQILVIYNFFENQRDEYIRQINQGVIVFSHIPLKDAAGNPLPMVLLPSPGAVQKFWRSLGTYMKQVFELPSIGITGSIGKTTLTLFLQKIFSEHYNVFVSGGNLNTAEYIVRQMSRSYGTPHNFHIQEMGGGYPTCVESSASMIKPDAFLIANVLPHHLSKYKTIEGVLHDKTSFDRVCPENSFGVINIDDNLLRTHKFQHRVVTCGIEHTEADYVAENIRQEGAYLTLDVLHGSERTHVRVNIPGKHNAYNVLLAFAMAKEWGISNESIVCAFEKYRSGTIRQSLTEVSGRTMYVDCFNICADSIHSCLNVLESMPVAPGNRRIAIIGGENALGAQAYSVNYGIGLSLADHPLVDEYVFLGPSPDLPEKDIDHTGNAWAVYQGAKKSLRDRKISFSSDPAAVARKLAQETLPGDVILFKGIIYLPFWPIIDMAFGTSFTNYVEYSTPGTVLREPGISVKYWPDIDGCNILSFEAKGQNVTIPDTVGGKSIFRIGRGIFAGNKAINAVDFGRSLVNIGARAFKGCTGLTVAEIPRNVLRIEEDAFAGCTGLTRISLLGAEHLESGAFRNCTNLTTVELSSRCITIADNAFEGCKDFTIVAPSDSPAIFYAKAHNIPFRAL